MKIVSVVGARPEFIQAIPITRALRPQHQEILVHTGQHYDYFLSQKFFDELGIPAPDYNLEVGSGSHARQSAEILVRFEEVLEKERPDVVIVRGDTNSTLAGALAACKLCIPVVHIEAGERSYDPRMPEEINRLVADRLSSVYFCASQTAVRQLAKEGITKNVFWTGDVMLDANITNRPIARQKSSILSELQLVPGQYSLVTVHRARNADDPKRLTSIVQALNQAGETVIFPAHPRTLAALEKVETQFRDSVRLIKPVGYFDMLVLEENARIIATDSGGVQREAYFMSKPCLTLRDETEWTETVEVGWNKLVGVDVEKILSEWKTFSPPAEQPPIFGTGRAGREIADILEKMHLSLN
ncbi:MAG: UDP-N-acetylglucosamine 2-epimerase (non-hydrolyzing) [Chloroflexota bacterium]